MTQAVCPACGGSFVMPPPRRPLACPQCEVPLARGRVERGGAGPHRSTEQAHVAVPGLSPSSRVRIERTPAVVVFIDGRAWPIADANRAAAVLPRPLRAWLAYHLDRELRRRKP